MRVLLAVDEDVRRLLEGSVSRYVVGHAPCPVEVIHSQAEKEVGEDG